MIFEATLQQMCFSNFGFMGNAVVGALFPDVLLEYLLFTLILWSAIYMWGVPCLLMESNGADGRKSSLKNLINPMFICMLVGMMIGIAELPLPAWR